jgi:fructokinase
MIVVAGESLVDLIVSPDGTVTAVPGGGPFNTARTVARLGVSCAFLGCLSTDRFGQRLRAALEADGVRLDHSIATDAPTTLAVAELDERGSARYRFYLDATSAAALTSDGGAVGGATAALHVGTLGLVMEPIGSTIERLVASLPEQVLLMVDPNCRPDVIRDRAGWRRRLAAILRRADVVKVSGDDLAYLSPGESRDPATTNLIGQGARVVLATDGGGPVLVRTPAGSLDLPVPATPVVDTVGSGDAFGGGFLAWWIRHGLGRDELGDLDRLHVAVSEAIEVARLTCQRPGADPPRLAEVQGSREGWP